MAPALTSSFHLTSAAPFPKPYSLPSRTPSTIVCAKNEETSKPNKLTKFSFDFGKLPEVNKLIPLPSTPKGVFGRRKEKNTVFVAGATGQVGIRVARMLLREGFAVRAGVPDLAAAQELAKVAAAYKLISPEESKRFNAVESTFADPESIARAIGPASKLAVTVSSSEDGPVSPVTFSDALNVITAAQLAGISHVTVIYNSVTPTSNGSSTNNVLEGLTSFFNNFFAKKDMISVDEFLDKLVETDVKFTVIKTGLADDFDGEEYPLVVSKEGSGVATEAKVSKSQIARLVADVFSNTVVAENKVVEVSSSSSASSKPTAQLFSAIPEDGRRQAYQEAAAKAKAAEEAVTASAKAKEAAEAAKNLEVEVKKLSEQKALAASFAQEAQERAAAAGSSLDSLLKRAKNISGDLSWEKLSSQITTAVAQKIEEVPKVQVATMRGQTKALNLPARKAVVKKPAAKPKSKQTEAKPEAKPEVNLLFGGLFKQETIYMDD